MNFQWSLQPMLRWMSCIGIYLESPGSVSSSPFRIWTIAYGLVVFFLHLYRNAVFLDEYFSKFKNASLEISTPLLWNAAINMSNYLFVTTGSQLSLIVGSISRWPSLTRLLRQMEKEHFFEAKHYRRFRRISISALAFLIAVLVVITVVMTLMVVPSDMPIMTKVGELLQPTLVMYLFSGGVLFSCIGWITSEMFVILAEKVTQQLNKSCTCNQTDWSRRLDSWRHQHHTLLKLVDKINNCYSGLLLVLIAASFVMMINSSFVIMRRLPNMDILLQLSILIIQFGHFAVLIYVPHRIRESAINFTKTLRCLNLDNQILQEKLNFFIVDALDSLPKITALGLFDVNLHLVPSIVGTTLTYLIILCQFQYSKN
ncbi:hypothetical protein GHT06_010008 [Daphnia sinensis]|uniref:Gustatory receptor n=1 Tax=Daphnia sinensis TaxID=1820382 RepID=A0AAD5LGW2_9CRUS|nr:hypothetical protein GHT06_010008 [Daphnia sinensis]